MTASQLPSNGSAPMATPRPAVSSRAVWTSAAARRTWSGPASTWIPRESPAAARPSSPCRRTTPVSSRYQSKRSRAVDAAGRSGAWRIALTAGSRSAVARRPSRAAPDGSGRTRHRSAGGGARSGDGRYAVDAGRYRYALRSESSPPIMGTIRRKYSECAQRTSGLGGSDTSRKTARPPGRITRAASPKHAAMSTTLRSAKPLIAPSTDASAIGSCRASARTRGAEVCARASISAAMSTPTARSPARPRPLQRSPVPQPRSTTRAPGSRCSSRTARRRQPASSPSVITRFTSS